MIQVFSHLRDGRFVADSSEIVPLKELPAYDEETITWLDVLNPTQEELAWLGSRYLFHPLALEDCAHFDQRSKIEEFTDHLFVVVHGLRESTGGTPGGSEDYELHCFIKRNLVVTVHDGAVPAIEALKARVRRDRGALPVDASFLLHAILDGVVDAIPAQLDALELKIDVIEEKLTDPRAKGAVNGIGELHELQQKIAAIRKLLGPQRDLFVSIVEGRYELIGEKSRVYFRDISDHLMRALENLEELRERVWSTRDACLAFSSQKTNEAMKRLTIFSVVFLPLTFITGFFGMNFTGLPFGDQQLLWATVGAVLVLPIATVLWLKSKDWL